MNWKNDHFTSLRGPSDRLASWFDWTTPNLVTLFGALLVMPMVWAFITGQVLLGCAWFLLGIFTDVLDGPLARYQEAAMSTADKAVRDTRPLLLRRGQTSQGSAFDPFVDKLRFFAAVLSLGWPPALNPWLLGLTGLFAAGLTVGRLFIKAKANQFGKIKAAMELGLILVLSASALGVQHLFWPANIMLALAMLGGFASLATQGRTWWQNTYASR